MSIIIGKARADCHDCGESLEGGLSISPWSTDERPVGVATGELAKSCAEHHLEGKIRDRDKETGETIIEHNKFSVFSNDRRIGRMTVVSMEAGYTFVIEDEETKAAFYEEIIKEKKRRSFI